MKIESACWLRLLRPMGRLNVPIAILISFVGRVHGQCGGTWTQRSPATAPSARSDVAMVYDAARSVSVMFGGVTASGSLNETWFWDGATWALQNPTTSPTKRFDVAMAFDSARDVSVLFGGRNTSQFAIGETWEWDGTNWTQKMPAHAPAPRNSPAMAYDSSHDKVVLFGGDDENDNFVGDTWQWDGVDWSMISPTNAPTPRYGHAMAYDAGRGVIVLFGGFLIGSPAPSDETWEWNGTDWSLKHPSPTPPGRAHHNMAFDPDRGVTVLFGGTIASGDSVDDVWEWDGTNWSQRQPMSSPSARFSHGMAYDSGRHTTVLFGGFSGVRSNETWEWTGPTPSINQQPADQSIAAGQGTTFSIAATGPVPLTFRWQKDGTPLSNGGPIDGTTTATLTINPTAASDAGSYSCLVSNPCGKTLSRAAILIIIEDPCTTADLASDCNGNGVVDSCEIAADASLDVNGNGTLDSCEEEPSSAAVPCGLCGANAAAMMPMALAGLCLAKRRRSFRFARSQTCVLTTCVFLTVITIQIFASQADAQCGGTWTQRTPADAPSPRSSHAMSYDSARGLTVLFGGYNRTNDDVFNETWEWNGASWTLRSTPFAPTRRIGHSMAYDSARGVTVLFGGNLFDQLNNETWEWNGTSWSLRFPAAAPSVRYDTAMAYDASRGVTVLFGGYDNHDIFRDTWEWDGTNWTQAFPADAPPAVHGHAMAFDSARSETLLSSGGGAMFNTDTWVWDGTNWSKRFPIIVPDERLYPATAYDSGRDAIVMFGGVRGLAQNGETFEWDGTTWLFRTPVAAPAPRSSHSMVFDAARGVTVLFGGVTGTSFTPNNETWEWTGPMPGVTQQPANQSVSVGQAATFSIAADGAVPLTFAWQKDGLPLSDGGAVAGSSTATLTINQVNGTDSGSYACEVTNPCGTTLSAAATLHVDVCNAVDATGDCNGNGILDSCDIAADASLDANGNGILDSCEQLASPVGAPCGLCGGGVATIMPITLIGLIGARKKGWY